MDKRTASTLGTLAAALVLALVWWALPGSGDSSGDSGGAGRADGGAESAAPSVVASGTTRDPALPVVAEADLPAQARDTLRRIDRGGPFASPRHDGTVFENREGRLPREQRGYYHEYTVPTPGDDDRGPRRIITGSADEFYWTADHYATFELIDRS